VKTNGVGVPKWKLQGYDNGRGTRGCCEALWVHTSGV